MTAPGLVIAMAALAANRKLSPSPASAGKKSGGQAVKQPKVSAAKDVTQPNAKNVDMPMGYRRIVSSIVNEATVKELQATINALPTDNPIAKGFAARGGGTLRNHISRILEDGEYLSSRGFPQPWRSDAAQILGAAKVGLGAGYGAPVQAGISLIRTQLGLAATPAILDSNLFKVLGAYVGEVSRREETKIDNKDAYLDSCIQARSYGVKWDYFYSTLYQLRGAMGASARKHLSELFVLLVTDPRMKYMEWAAYLLGTASLETMNFSAMAEVETRSKKFYYQELDYACGGQIYKRSLHGRGYIQLTAGVTKGMTVPYNPLAYAVTSAKMFQNPPASLKSNKLVDEARRKKIPDACILVAYPELVVEPKVAYETAVYGLLYGTLHGKYTHEEPKTANSKPSDQATASTKYCLNNYIKALANARPGVWDPELGYNSPQYTSYVGARAIVNGSDRNVFVAARAVEFEFAFRQSLWAVPGVSRQGMNLTYGGAQ
jgi:hypothetical protein